MRLVLRAGLLSWLVLLVLIALEGGALAARNLFDDDYQDCPASVRLARLTGVQAVRTTKDEELQVEWDAAPWASWNLHGGTAEITVLVQSQDRTQSLQKAHKALGATRATFKDVNLATDWVIQVAVTDRAKVISDIVEVEFTSGVKKPLFSSGLYYEAGHTTKLPAGVAAGSDRDKSDNEAANLRGTFYYLGFNTYFDNWYAEGAPEGFDRPRVDFDRNNDGNRDSYPATAKFRVGLRHGVANPGDAKFNHFRIRVEDANGDDVLGFDAATVVDSAYPHGTKEFAFQVRTAPAASRRTANLAESHHLHDDGRRVDAMHERTAPWGPVMGKDLGLWHARLDGSVLEVDFSNPANRNTGACLTAAQRQLFNSVRQVARDMSFAELRTFTGTEVDATPEYYLYAELPHQIYDLPKELFGQDGTFTLTAWAADPDDRPISSEATLTFSVQERLRQRTWLLPGYTKPAASQVFWSVPTYYDLFFIATRLDSRVKELGGLYYDNGGTPGDPSDDTCGIDIPRLNPVPSSRMYHFDYNHIDDSMRSDAVVVGLTVTQK